MALQLPPQPLVKRLLSGKFSGWEAGQLWILDSVEVDHGRQGFLTAEQADSLAQRLPPRERDAFNALQLTYQRASFTIKEAEAIAARVVASYLVMASSNMYARLDDIRGLLREALKGASPRQASILRKADRGLDEALRFHSVSRDLELRKLAESTGGNVLHFTAIRLVMRELSSKLDICLTEDVDAKHQEMADAYEKLIIAPRGGDILPDPWKLMAVKYGYLKSAGKVRKGVSTAKLERWLQDKTTYYRERFTMTLGPDWWQ